MSAKYRSVVVAKAWNHAERWLLDWQETNDLTGAEIVGFHAAQLASLAKHAMQDERALRRPTASPPSGPPP